jgi:hypothetical protein
MDFNQNIKMSRKFTRFKASGIKIKKRCWINQSIQRTWRDGLRRWHVHVLYSHTEAFRIHGPSKKYKSGEWEGIKANDDDPNYFFRIFYNHVYSMHPARSILRDVLESFTETNAEGKRPKYSYWEKRKMYMEKRKIHWEIRNAYIEKWEGQVFWNKIWIL